MKQQIIKIGQRATCAECGKAIIYGNAGWMHWRQPTEPHLVVMATQPPIVEDALTKALARNAELEALADVQYKRIETLLAANRELSEKVRR